MPEQLFISQGYQSGDREERKTPGASREGLCGGLELDSNCA